LQQVVFLDVEVGDSRKASNLPERREIQRVGGLVRLHDDGSDAFAAVRIDQHAVAATQCQLTCQIVVEVTGSLKGDRNYFGKLDSAFEGIDLTAHLFAPQRLCRIHPVLLGL